MNTIFFITQALGGYRQALVSALEKGGPYTTDTFVVVCSAYDKDFNVTTYEQLSAICDNVVMQPMSIAPFDGDKRELDDYINEIYGYNLWRLKITGETLYMPPNTIPASTKWNKDWLKAYRESGTTFYGTTIGEDKERWLNGMFITDASFYSTNPCLRGYNRKQMFMYRARNYTNRSTTVMAGEPVVAYTEATEPVQDEPVQEAPVQKAPAKKAAKKKTAKKRAKKAAKKSAKKAAKKPAYEDAKPSIAEAIEQMRKDQPTES